MIYCADIGGSFIKFATSPEPGEIGDIAIRPTPFDNFDVFCQTLQELIAIHSGNPKIPLSLSLAGIIDTQNNIMRCANIACLNGRHPNELAERINQPLIITNDADCFTLAEARRTKGFSTIFGIILGSGVGGGLVINGKLIQGKNGYTGEWGHGPILHSDSKTEIPAFACGCGQIGCIDTIGGARGLERIHLALHHHELSSHDIIMQWQQQNQAACTTIKHYINLLAGPLAMVINTIGADYVPVGGGLSNVSKLIAALDEAMRKRLLAPLKKPLLVQSFYRENAGLIGASYRGFENIMT